MMQQGIDHAAEQRTARVRGHAKSEPTPAVIIPNDTAIAARYFRSASLESSKRIVFSWRESYNLRHVVPAGGLAHNDTAFSGTVQSCSPLAAIT